MKVFYIFLAITFCNIQLVHADWKKTDVKLKMPGFDIDLYNEPALNAQKLKTISAKKFPKQVWFLETSDNSMHHIKITYSEKSYWVKSTVVSLPDIEKNKKIMCDSTTQTTPGNTGKGLGDKNDCEKSK
ncbi:hypothetical protein WH96_15715 [Kiloniella spongiae]|uniref:Uncharacterized protein n=1 Tax=Kiloniella spongiae TaxID=1489064 RepID=A0A0H2MBU6_9PROT|nr:hypothetical protein [Kiloniella spongiae]KLN59828.1 hypothetical protein WH96_15715 [Kiloniella spongiae]